MAGLIKVIKDIPRVSHRVIAENTNNKESSLDRLISLNITDFEEFGTLHVKFEKIKTRGGVQRAKVFLLNEEQATLLMTYLRNSSIVKEFKKRLVKEFFSIKDKSKNSIIQLKRENIELKRALNRLLIQDLSTNVEKLKEQNTLYYENWQGVEGKLKRLKGIFDSI